MYHPDDDDVEYYLKSKTPYNFCEPLQVREVDHQIIIDAMDDQCQVHSIKYPKEKDDEPINFCPFAGMRPKVDKRLNVGYAKEKCCNDSPDKKCSVSAPEVNVD